jgi:hypothetical protein
MIAQLILAKRTLTIRLISMSQYSIMLIWIGNIKLKEALVRVE